MRITKETVRRLAEEAERATGKPMIESINTPGDGRVHYVMAESMTSTYYGARTAAAYLLGVLTGAHPEGQIHWVENRPEWITEIDDAFRFGSMAGPAVQAFHAGYAYGRSLRRIKDQAVPVGAWRVLAKRHGRSFTRLGGQLTDAGPVEAGTMVTVESVTDSTAYVRTQDGRELRVILSELVQSQRRKRDRYSAIVTYEDKTSVRTTGTWREITDWLPGQNLLGTVASTEIGRVLAEGVMPA